jgi:hypothetical protein
MHVARARINASTKKLDTHDDKDKNDHVVSKSPLDSSHVVGGLVISKFLKKRKLKLLEKKLKEGGKLTADE